MKKLLSGPLLGVIALMTLVTACGTFSVAKRPGYAGMIGKEYILQRDCYIFRFSDDKKVLHLSPVGADTPGLGTIPPSENMDVRLIGKKFASFEILGALPKQTVVKIVDIKHVVKFEIDCYQIFVGTNVNGAQRTYEAMFLQEEKYNGARFDPRFIVEKKE